MVGKVERYLTEKVTKEGCISAILIDPDKMSLKKGIEVAKTAEEVGVSVILMGGSTGVTQSDMDKMIRAIKPHINLPIVIFPGNVSNLSPHADAVLFMSLLNSSNIYWIIGAQVQGALMVRKFKLEAIPTAYIIIGFGGAAGYIGEARPIPYDKPELALAYSLAAQMLGMRFIYLEAGSGAPRPVPPELISIIRKEVQATLIVGGGIRSEEDAKRIARAGADIIVTGTLTEVQRDTSQLRVALMKILRGIRAGVAERFEN